MKRSAPAVTRPLGTAPPPRRRAVAPAAVRLAQLALAVRMVAVAVIVPTAGLAAAPIRLALPWSRQLMLPGAALWTSLAAWIVAASVLEGAMVLRLGRLRAGSRRVILLVESAAIAGSGAYVAAGVKAGLVPMVSAIAAVVLLRLDHVRHSFDRARAERRRAGQTIPAVLYDGYRFVDPLREKQVQSIGYRYGVDYGRVEADRSTRSTA